MSRPAAYLALALSAVLSCACTWLRPLDGLSCEPGAGNSSCLYGQPCDADADCATAACRSSACQCPDDMVAVESTFCVDRTEVSNAAYRRFAKEPSPLSEQEAFCSWNGAFDFDTEPPSCQTRRTDDEAPASCVNWCSAYAFCRSLGRRLCGKPHGGPSAHSSFKDPAQSEWFNACSRGGARAYPTGELEDASCNGDSAEAAPVGVAGQEVCEGGYLGLMHMSGNVREWEDSCSGAIGPQDQCRARGGAFDSGGDLTELRCDADDVRDRDDTDATIGFRCCSG